MGKSVRYIVLGNEEQWCYYSWKGEIEKHNIEFVMNFVPLKGLVYKLWKKHFYHAEWPLHKLWYGLIKWKLNICREEETYLFIYDWNYLTKDLFFFKQLKSLYPKLKLVYLFSNIVKDTGAKTYGILDKLNNYFDFVFAFDLVDAEKYGFKYSPLIYTQNEIGGDNGLKGCVTDLFYIGKAKDRLEQLLAIYEKAVKEGLKCDFTIFGVEEEKQKYSESITYNKKMAYSDVLQRISKSRCLVDAIQGESTGLTIKTCEAVIYNKKLITTNANVKREPFYSPNRIRLWQELDNISEFINEDCSQYTYDDKYIFSPSRLFEEIRSIKL